ncbi:hypothetical protein E4U54_006313 [Claviceps lovelessii]|nr:hypothetical protein E4U54_006313 [Claviceps lovelessii]
MSLVSSNDAETTKAVISSAIKTYRASNTPSGQAQRAQRALDTLTQLRGIGPATASLLLHVHDPRRAIFFSDEAYWWLCGGGNVHLPIRYSAKEYRLLCDKAAVLAGRLGGDKTPIHMVDVEKAAYVAVRTGPIKKENAGRKPKPGKLTEGATKTEEQFGEEDKAETEKGPRSRGDASPTEANKAEEGERDGEASAPRREAGATKSTKKKVRKADEVEETQETQLRRSKRLNR